MSSEIATMSLHDTSNVIAIPRPAKLDTLQPGIIYHIAQHLRVATPLQVPSCRCSKPIRKLSPPQAGEGYKISPTDPAFNLSRVCTSLKGVLETEVKGEFRTTYCSVGIEGCARVSGVLRENVRSLKISAGSQHAIKAEPVALHDMVRHFPNTESLHLAWAFHKGSPKYVFAPTPASPTTTLDKITSVTIDLRGQRLEPGFGAAAIGMLLVHLPMPNVRSLTLWIQREDEKRAAKEREWERLQAVLETVRLERLERFTLGMEVNVMQQNDNSMSDSPFCHNHPYIEHTLRSILVHNPITHIGIDVLYSFAPHPSIGDLVFQAEHEIVIDYRPVDGWLSAIMQKLRAVNRGFRAAECRVDGRMQGLKEKRKGVPYPRHRLVDFHYAHGGLPPSALLQKDTRPREDLLAVRTDRDHGTDEWIYHYYPVAAKLLESDFKRAARGTSGFAREKETYEEAKAYKQWLNPHGISMDFLYGDGYGTGY